MRSRSELPSSNVWKKEVIDVRGERFNTVDFASHSEVPVWDFVSNMLVTDEVILNPDFSSSPMMPILRELHKKGQLVHSCLRMLLQPSPSLTNYTITTLAKSDPNREHYLIGIHIRTGDNQMHTTKKKRDFRGSHPHEYRMAPESSFECFARESVNAWEELSLTEQAKYPKGPLVFISGDYPRGRAQVASLLANAGFPSFDAGNWEVNHLDRSGDQTRTYLDWWFLTQCQQLVITVSGFSEFAAQWPCVPVSFFVNHPTLKKHNSFGGADCEHHFIRMRGRGLCVPEIDDNLLYEFMYERFQ